MSANHYADAVFSEPGRDAATPRVANKPSSGVV